MFVCVRVKKHTVRKLSALILCLYSSEMKRAAGRLKCGMGRAEDKFSDCLLMGEPVKCKCPLCKLQSVLG